MLRCKEVTRLHASGELAIAGRVERLQVRLHLMMCRHCRRYVDQLKAIARSAAALQSDPDPARVDAIVARVLSREDSTDGAGDPSRGDTSG